MASAKLCSIIRAIRAELGENTATFGVRLAVSGRTVEDWEQGRRKPRGLVLRALAKLAKRHVIAGPR